MFLITLRDCAMFSLGVIIMGICSAVVIIVDRRRRLK